jgi:hypothetical protein
MKPLDQAKPFTIYPATTGTMPTTTATNTIQTIAIKANLTGGQHCCTISHHCCTINFRYSYHSDDCRGWDVHDLHPPRHNIVTTHDGGRVPAELLNKPKGSGKTSQTADAVSWTDWKRMCSWLPAGP